MKRFLLRMALPWTITFLSLYIACRDIRWDLFLERLHFANWNWILLTVVVMTCSYLGRARRWQRLLPAPELTYTRSLRAMLIGFLMNNVLPARMGELVRAAVGGRVTGASRAMVLGSIASERLVDGLTLSLFLLLSIPYFSRTSSSGGLQLVALGFFLAGASIVTIVLFRNRLNTLAELLLPKLPGRLPSLILSKMKIFLRGLFPLASWPGCIPIAVWSLGIWLIELSTFFTIGLSFQTQLSLPYATLFLVSVNFSSLIPAAPGGIGVIEAATTTVLSAAGFEKELALSIVLIQHVIQFMIILVGGTASLVSLRRQFGIDRRMVTSLPKETRLTEFC